MTPHQYKKIRKALGTQEEVAKALGLHRYTVNRREAGAMPISEEAARAIRDLARERGKA